MAIHTKRGRLLGQHFDGGPPRNLNHVFLRQFENGFNKKIDMFMFKNQNDGATLSKNKLWVIVSLTESEQLQKNLEENKPSRKYLTNLHPPPPMPLRSLINYHGMSSNSSLFTLVRARRMILGRKYSLHVEWSNFLLFRSLFVHTCTDIAGIPRKRRGSISRMYGILQDKSRKIDKLKHWEKSQALKLLLHSCPRLNYDVSAACCRNLNFLWYIPVLSKTHSEVPIMLRWPWIDERQHMWHVYT